MIWLLPPYIHDALDQVGGIIPHSNTYNTEKVSLDNLHSCRVQWPNGRGRMNMIRSLKALHGRKKGFVFWHA